MYSLTLENVYHHHPGGPLYSERREDCFRTMTWVFVLRSRTKLHFPLLNSKLKLPPGKARRPLAHACPTSPSYWPSPEVTPASEVHLGPLFGALIVSVAIDTMIDVCSI